jgi:hypothetical protein
MVVIVYLGTRKYEGLVKENITNHVYDPFLYYRNVYTFNPSILKKTRFIICRYNENPIFLNYIPEGFEVWVYNKGSDFTHDRENLKIIKQENIGFETYTYLKYMIDNFDNLADINVFIQASFLNSYKFIKFNQILHQLHKGDNKFFYAGTQFYHRKQDVLGLYINSYCLTSNHNKCKIKHSSHRPLQKWLQHYFPEITTIDIYNIGYNSFLIIPKENIRKVGLPMLQRLISFYTEPGVQNEEIHYMERLWATFFN